ncbi:MAG: hypothetical protein Q9Q40_02825 [Acidobacteriota bacterium]|nr:hypothetical protein [Acidobacteriota bacterium]
MNVTVFFRTIFTASAVLTTAVAAAPSAPPEAWVVEECALQVEVIDTDSGASLAVIDLRDPDGDGAVDPPWGLAFSTVPGAVDDFAFVTQQGLVSLIDVRARAVSTAAPYFDVAAALGRPGLVLRGCATSPPRWFVDPTGARGLRSLLDVAGTLSDGRAVFVVLDQQELITGGAHPVVTWGILGRGRGTSVSVSGLPAGRGRHTPLYGVIEENSQADALAVYQVTLGEDLLAGAQVELLRRSELGPGTAPSTFRPAAATGRRFPVMPLGPAGGLENLDTGGSCTPGGTLASVAIAGPGPNSYTVFALDGAADEIVVVDPADCSVERFAAEAGARDLAVDRPIEWTRLLVANRDDDSLSRLLADGSLARLPLGGGPTANLCPVTVALPATQVCAVELTGQFKADLDGDGSQDDIRLEWQAPGCPSTQGYTVYCQCIDAGSDCPCACDCLFPDPSCICPGVGGTQLGLGGSTDTLLVNPWDPPVLENPWKKLGTTFDTGFDHLGGAAGDGVAYGVTLEDQPPP